MKIKSILLICAFFILSGCSSNEIEGTYSLNSDSGIYDYLHGTVKNVSEVYAVGSDGSTFKGEVNDDGFYQIAVPSLGIEQTVEVFLKNDKETLNEHLIIDKKETIDDYENFAFMMNAVIESINENAKTRFPVQQKDGTQDVSIENGVTTSVNVYDGKLIGLDMHANSFANNELPTLLAAFQGSYDATNDRIAEAYNNTMETKERNSFTSNGYKFTFEYSLDDLYASIIKVK